MRRVVVALGGNALLPAGAKFDLETHHDAIEWTAPVLVHAARSCRMVITFGTPTTPIGSRYAPEARGALKAG